jgi:hypothetical protein
VVDYESLIACRMMGCMAFISLHTRCGWGVRAGVLCYTFLDGGRLDWFCLTWLHFPLHIFQTRVFCTRHMIHTRGGLRLAWLHLRFTFSGLGFYTHMIHAYTGRRTTAFGF